MGALRDLLIGTAGSLMAAELYCSLPRISAWLTKYAAARLPARMRERYSEEWLAHLRDCAGHIRQFTAALGFVWSSKKFMDHWHAERDPTSRRDMWMAYPTWVSWRFLLWLGRAHPILELYVQFSSFVTFFVLGYGLRIARDAVTEIAEAIYMPHGNSPVERRTAKRLRISKIVRRIVNHR